MKISNFRNRMIKGSSAANQFYNFFFLILVRVCVYFIKISRIKIKIVKKLVVITLIVAQAIFGAVIQDVRTS